MGIGQVGTVGQAGSYGGGADSYAVRKISAIEPEELKKQEQERLAKENGQFNDVRGSGQQTGQPHVTPEDAEKARIASLQNISLTFNQSEDFGYLGQDASIAGLDMEKAISDLKKDQVLEQYQYFVGGTPETVISTEDGTVIRK